MKSDVIDVIFIDLKGKAYKFNIKESGGDIKEAFIGDLPPARYYIYLEYNGIKYNALQHIIIE